jgi:hypothetical protein
MHTPVMKNYEAHALSQNSYIIFIYNAIKKNVRIYSVKGQTVYHFFIVKIWEFQLMIFQLH